MSQHRKKKSIRNAESARTKAVLEQLSASDPEAFFIAFSLASDPGLGAHLYGLATRSVQRRVDRMLQSVQILLATHVRPSPAPTHRPRSPRRGRKTRR